MANNSEREASPLKRADTIRLTVEDGKRGAMRLDCTSIPKLQRIISSFPAQEQVKGVVLLGHSRRGFAR
jgi:hypothetical protein